MWRFKYFSSISEMNNWLEKRKDKIQYDQVFVNNGYGIEWRKLKIIRC